MYTFHSVFIPIHLGNNYNGQLLTEESN